MASAKLPHALSQSQLEANKRMRFAFVDIFNRDPDKHLNSVLLVGGLLASATCIDYQDALIPELPRPKEGEPKAREKTRAEGKRSKACKFGPTHICLELLEAATKCSPIPGLEGVVKIVRVMITTVEEAKVNKAECEDLVKRVAYVLCTIQDQVEGDPDFEEHCKGLENDLQEILQDIEYIASRSKWANFFRAGELKERIADCDKRLGDIQQRFQMRAGKSTHRRINNAFKETVQAQAQTNRDALHSAAYWKGHSDAVAHAFRSAASNMRSSTILSPRTTSNPPTSDGARSSRPQKSSSRPARGNAGDDGGRSRMREYDDRRRGRRDR